MPEPISEFDLVKFIDPPAEVSLSTFGLASYTAAESVDRNGDRQLWLVNRDLLGEPQVDHGDEQPDHERTGRLPAAFRDRVWGDALRCGRPTTAGRPCRARVAEPGAACPSHREVCR